MLIQCTKKLLDELELKPELESQLESEYEPLFSWHANLITVNRRKVVVLMNDKNRYAIFLYGLKGKDFKKFDDIVLEAIRLTFEEEYVKDSVIEAYLNHFKSIVFGKTKNKSMVAKLNKACDHFYFYPKFLDHDESIYKTIMGKKTNKLIVGDGKDGYITPNEELYKDLEAFIGEPIFGSKAVELNVTLSLERQYVWRKVVVPLNMPFSIFHEVLQAAFGWQDYHLHDFYIFDDKVKQARPLSVNHSGYHPEAVKPIVNLVSDEEALSYPDEEVEMKLEKGIRLADYLPKYKRMKYNYDFGDNWEHYIEVERVIDDFDKNYSICLEGEGVAPPEDVGGPSGYEEFLEIMNDEKHPDYESTVTWSSGHWENKFDIEVVNRKLKNID